MALVLRAKGPCFIKFDTFVDVFLIHKNSIQQKLKFELKQVDHQIAVYRKQNRMTLRLGQKQWQEWGENSGIGGTVEKTDILRSPLSSSNAVIINSNHLPKRRRKQYLTINTTSIMAFILGPLALLGSDRSSLRCHTHVLLVQVVNQLLAFQSPLTRLRHYHDHQFFV